MIGIENQTDPDPNMPIRAISYDAAAYRSQLLQDDVHSLYPVLSLVLYCGHQRPWNGPFTLKECLAIPPALEPHVFDYGMNLYQLAWMTHEEVDRRFHGDFWIFADYLVQVRENKAYHPTRRTLRHKREIIMLLNAMERDNRYETAYNDLMQDPVKSKEDWNMCDVLDQVENRGVARGIEQGIEQERKRIVLSLAANGVTLQDIAVTLQLSQEMVAEMLQDAN